MGLEPPSKPQRVKDFSNIAVRNSWPAASAAWSCSPLQKAVFQLTCRPLPHVDPCPGLLGRSSGPAPDCHRAPELHFSSRSLFQLLSALLRLLQALLQALLRLLRLLRHDLLQLAAGLAFAQRLQQLTALPILPALHLLGSVAGGLLGAIVQEPKDLSHRFCHIIYYLCHVLTIS